VRADRRIPLICAGVVVVAVGVGCGGGSDRQPKPVSGQPRATTTTATTDRSTSKPHGHAVRPAARRATVRVPPGWHVKKHPVTRRNWPVPLKVAASFPIHRASPNASCPVNVIRSFPPDGVYLMIAEFTGPRPRGIPPRGQLPPRGDLRHLDIRESEVECFENGLSGAKDFTENGRSFRVEILLGRGVSAERRRQALEALGSLRIPPP
jgi:hypothetical protein